MFILEIWTSDLNSKTFRLLTASFEQQSSEPSLLEVFVGRQCFQNSTALHHDKRNAVSQPPVFVRSCVKQSNTVGKQLFGKRLNRDLGVRFQRCQKLIGGGPESLFGQ